MVLTIKSEWSDGTVHTSQENVGASKGRYIMAAITRYPRKYKKIPNGFQYETPHRFIWGMGRCVTTVTLTRGFV